MRHINALLLACLLLLAACKKEDDAGNPPPPSPSPPPAVNRAPVADAGADAAAMTGAVVNLSAAASTDPDSDTLTYSWVIISGPAGGTISNASQPAASFQATVAGTYVLEVTVRDPGNLSSVDSVTLTISDPAPPPPPAFGIAGLPAHVIEGTAGTLTITLPAPAAAGGTLVTLLSSNSSAIEVPASVAVLEGETQVSVPIDTAATGAATITASMPGEAPAILETQVEPDVLNIAVSTGDAGVMVGGQPVIAVTLRTPAPAGGARVNLVLSNGSRAALERAQLDLAAGTSVANTALTALSPGMVEVSATLEGTNSTERVRVAVIPVAASGIRTSESLIEEKRAAGQISSEQALVYRVLATFGAAELPAEFRGNDYGKLDGSAVREATVKLAGFSPASQAAVARYLFPPIYSGSWGQPQKALLRRVDSLPPAESCFDQLAGMPTAETLPGWKAIRTASFKIWYPTAIDHRNAELNLYSAEDVQAAALNVAATIQRDYDKLLAVFGAPPISDADLPCNGGDGAIDVYVTRVGLGEMAQVMPYLPGECARPGWMWVAPDAALDARATRNIIGHELVHLFQLKVARPDCGEWRYNILDEATASWAFDHLYRGDNYEHRFAVNDGAYFDGSRGEWHESPVYGHGVGAFACNGYCDYPFFEWLDRKYGPQAIKQVIEATGSASAQRAFEVGLGGIGGGLEQLWPKFALAMWNDYENHVADEWNGWERLPGASLRKSYVQAENHFIEATLDGASKRDLKQALINITRGDLDPMTMEYVQIRFTDEDVTLVQLEPRGDVLHGMYPRVRLQALQKIDGQWKPVEDWSNKHEVKYCRDKKAERIQEIVPIYSNSHAGDAAFERDPPMVVNLMDEDAKLPRFEISNASCMPWQGTTSITITGDEGGRIHMTANVKYKVYVPPGEEPPEPGGPFPTLFVPESGTATMEEDWPVGGCRQKIDFVSGPIGELDGQLMIGYETRIVTAIGITNIQGPTNHTLECPDADPVVVPGPTVSTWLQLPPPGYPLGEDGRTIKGSYTRAEQGQVTTVEWDLSSEREE
jgi:hypothetical protein